jgi:RNA polymerase sigma factor (sigma-70 family)
MNERQSDFEWLQQFARAGNQNAFRDLVRRHIDLVFATAMHKVGDAGGAEEISQNVFSALARKAWQFAPDDSLPAWLHKTALLESKLWLRGELRRRRREETAAELCTTMKTPNEQTAFNALVPLLDDALLSLRERDRAALLLRFYEKQSLGAVGASLGVSEDTAQKRVQSALEKLSQFFQRRGYKTATVAAASAAMQHTAATASAATFSLVANAAIKSAPPALAGLGALLARFASLSKVQTVALCLVAVIAPVLWEWNDQRNANVALTQVKTSLTEAQNEIDSLQTERQRLEKSAQRVEDSLARARNTVDQRAELERKFASWKQQTRARLLAADYQWPDDLPFIRIPKAIVPQLQVRHPIREPGSVKQEARELLGLSPAEREQVEAALQKHFAAMDSLMNQHLYETNKSNYSHPAKDALASQVWGLPPLGGEVKQHTDELLAALKTTLGKERWPLIEETLRSSGTDTLRQTLNLDAGERGQQFAVWIEDRNGQLVVGYGWGTQNSSFSSGGLALSFFTADAKFPEGMSREHYLGFEQLPAALTRPAMEWLRQQADTRLPKKGGQ